MHRLLPLLAVGGWLLAPDRIPAQASPPPTSSELIRAARAQINVNQDSATALLRRAMAAAATAADSVDALVWTGIAHFYGGQDSMTRASFRAAFVLNPSLNVRNLDQVSPRLAALFEAERTPADRAIVHTTNGVDVQPRLVGGPPVSYPWSVWRRGVTGRAMLMVIVDTAGRVEPSSLQIEQLPDSGLTEPVRRMILASTFEPGRIRGRPVRTMMRLGIALQPGPPPNPTALVGQAREQLAARNPDSALVLVDMALDAAVHATEGERVYALLVRGIGWAAKGQDGPARAALDTGLAAYRQLTERGVDLAPFLRRLADSLRLGRRAGARAVATMAKLIVVGGVDELPALLSHPPIRYPPELWQLKVGGTVVVEATLDATGRVVPGSVKVVQSPNRGLNAEALRVVAAASYRPARSGGRAVGAVIRQPLTFVP